MSKAQEIIDFIIRPWIMTDNADIRIDDLLDTADIEPEVDEISATQQCAFQDLVLGFFLDDEREFDAGDPEDGIVLSREVITHSFDILGNHEVADIASKTTINVRNVGQMHQDHIKCFLVLFGLNDELCQLGFVG